MQQAPKKYDHKAVEQKWQAKWQEAAIYRWDSAKSREQTFVVDTPPPTVSGSLHVGHVFSYTHTDVIVRYQRMCGKNIMYPMGWDDNGLPTERRVQNKFGINCNPHLPYDPSWQPAVRKEKEKPVEISRKNFIEACAIVTEEDEAAFESLWSHLGLSVDWSQQYATIDAHCRKVSQLSFLDLVDKGLVYSTESPTMWDVTFRTALAQADIEDRNVIGAFHDLVFSVEGGGEFTISTTRPELLVACIAVVAHPDDQRYQQYFGKQAVTPLFRARVPILPSEHADPEKGTGILMVCTFGDAADVEFWKNSALPIKQVINRAGRFEHVDFTAPPFTSLEPQAAEEAYRNLVGKSVKQARKAVVQLLLHPEARALSDGPALVGTPRSVEHPVKFYEKGEEPVEFVTTRQWFIKLLEHKDELLAQGEKINWHPAHMKARYTHWVSGLNYDWCISRQRFFGVPFPVWYPLNESGEADYANPIFAAKEQLPVDPQVEVPRGFAEDQRDVPGGFTGDPDVMDTWATSSLTPQIVSQWQIKPERHQSLFPMDIRPQSHEIIRTWAFYTIAKAWFHERQIPWKNVIISGWILDPDRKKMSKSRGNVVTPLHLLDQYSADGVRYWAARARLGVDTAFDEKVLVSGQKLATKLFNASRFVLTQIDQFEEAGGTAKLADISQEVDRAQVELMRTAITEATRAFENFDYAQALQTAENAFWPFCDNYVELVKARAYAEEDAQARASAVAALEWLLSAFLRLFAPVMPYISEEIWSWHFAGKDGSFIHVSRWPSLEEVAAVTAPSAEGIMECAAEFLSAVRFAKSQAQKTLKWPVKSVVCRGREKDLEALAKALPDLEKAGRIEPGAVTLIPGEVDGKRFDTEIALGESEQAAG